MEEVLTIEKLEAMKEIINSKPNYPDPKQKSWYYNGKFLTTDELNKELFS